MSKIAGAKLMKVSLNTGALGDDHRYIKKLKLDGEIIQAIGEMKFDGFTDIIVAIDRKDVSSNVSWVATARKGCRFTPYVNVPDETWNTPYGIHTIYPEGSIAVLRNSYLHEVKDNKSMKFALETL